jgi:uncharacterized membrane protein
MVLKVILYSKQDCGLCDKAVNILSDLYDEYPHDLTIIDIESDPNLYEAFDLEIPVLEIGQYTIKAPITTHDLKVTLGAASDRLNHMQKIDKEHKKNTKKKKMITGTDKFTYWFSKYYLWVFNVFVLFYVGMPFLAPMLYKVGATAPATIIYRVYGGLCHQLGYRSWYLFGEQPVYPREAAGLDQLRSFQEATGVDESGLLAAREFIGNESIGYKVAYCQRDVAIYASMLLFGIIFGLSKKRIRSLPVVLWILVGMVPIGVDGVSQLISQFIHGSSLEGVWRLLDFIQYRESTPFLRTLTGSLFGFTTAWFGYPLVEEAMVDARNLLSKKFIKAKALSSSD